MFFLPQDLDDYIVAHSQNEPQILKDLSRETYQKVLQPIMLSGPYQGRVLSMISSLISPKRVLEVGTFTGYSALCLAEGMPENSDLVTIDINEELESLCSRYFLRFRESVKKINFIQKIGPALDIIPELEGYFDLVFIESQRKLMDIERQAAKLPSKLTVPVVLLSLPAILIIILGPSISAIFNSDLFGG